MDENTTETMEYAGVIVDIGNELLNERIRHALQWGYFEVAETQFVELYLEPENDVIELGGGMGYLACYIDQRLEFGQTHVVVEPNGYLLSLIDRHRKLNKGAFEVVNAAYSNQGQLAELQIPESFWKASLQDISDPRSVLHTGTVDLEAICERFNLSDVTVVADIEGAEVDLVENELDFLLSNCGLLIVEFHDEGRLTAELATAAAEARETLDSSPFELVDRDDGVSVYRPPDT